MKPRHVAVGVFLLGSAGLIYAALQPLRRSAQTSSCESNFKRIGGAMMIYIRDYDEKLPKADNWSDALQPYVTLGQKPSDPQAYFLERLLCPTSGSTYVYNRNLAGRSYVLINAATTPWLYEVGAGQNQLNISDDGKLWPSAPVHDTTMRCGNHVLFGDVKVRLSLAKPAFARFAPVPTPIKGKQ